MGIAGLNITDVIRHLRKEDAPFLVRRSNGGPVIADAAMHTTAWQADAELYALAALVGKVRPGQRARVLFQMLSASWAGLPDAQRITLRRAADRGLRRLPSDVALSVLLALRQVRANHKHVKHAILRYLLDHPRLPSLARTRRSAVVDCLEHALGRNVARGCAKILDRVKPTSEDLLYVRRNLLRFASDSNRATTVVRYLYRLGSALPADAADLDYVEPQAPERAKTITATNRGDISATLVHLYRGGESAELQAAVERYADQAAKDLPRFSGPVALVLDVSASTRSYGEREYACVAQSQALRLVMQRCCRDLRVHLAGDADAARTAALTPMPQGATDLATAVLDALEGSPDVVAIVSDGYENVAGGDLARLLVSLPQAGITTPMVFCHSKFTDQDELTFRRPTERVPAVTEAEFWHQDDFADVLWTIFSQAGNGRGDAFVRECLRGLLDAETDD